MRKVFIVAAALILASTSLTFAQASRKSVTAPESPAASTPEAPVGHRQPRRDAVPSSDNSGYQESAEDKALNRKIKSICRGC